MNTVMSKSGVSILLLITLKYIFAKDDLNQYVRNLYDPCGVNGTWMNEFGSLIDLFCGNGTLHGRYRIPTDRGEDIYEISGKYIVTSEDGEDRIVAFLVPWNNASSSGYSKSFTSYTGIYYSSKNLISTHWILTAYKEWGNRWATNLLGHNDFNRV
ncbi:hypothetical protein CHS0354_007958 [Potamilus streckersoni]|uniref:Uncharacterized protein n=1 Tax=Potamilus streckersoni TaxID=2493646 RepID=A0AAE0S8N8_9BIVA|nr:hypothetical protein CHS0354_007958 [Potamilus streckersoni]